MKTKKTNVAIAKQMVAFVKQNSTKERKGKERKGKEIKREFNFVSVKDYIVFR